MFRLLGLSLVFAIFVSGCGEPPREIFHVDKLELISLTPKKSTDPIIEVFHGWEVLGKLEIDDPVIQADLLNALQSGKADAPKFAARCFLPRHGLTIVSNGTTTELVICFECYQAQQWVDGVSEKGYLVSRSPQTVFDQILRDGKVPLAIDHSEGG